MTFLIFVTAFVALACLGLPLAVLGLFAALSREKPADRPLASVPAPGGDDRRDGSIPGPLGVT